VISDLGGVVIGSPLHAIATYEREKIRPIESVSAPTLS
jgi:hypothetical protein